jgi:hypothetical protein
MTTRRSDKYPPVARQAGALLLTERIQTPAGLARIAVTQYAFGTLCISLVGLGRDGAGKIVISIDPGESSSFATGEFVVQVGKEGAGHAPLLHRSPLFKQTGKSIPGVGEIWSLAGSAMLELKASLSRQISNVKFRAQVFFDVAVTEVRKTMLVAEFEHSGFTNHSPKGGVVWVIRQYCDRVGIPFCVQILEKNNAVIGVRVSKKGSQLDDHVGGMKAITVYETPARQITLRTQTPAAAGSSQSM